MSFESLHRLLFVLGPVTRKILEIQEEYNMNCDLTGIGSEHCDLFRDGREPGLVPILLLVLGETCLLLFLLLSTVRLFGIIT